MKNKALIYGGIAVGVLALIVIIVKSRKPKITTASLVDKNIADRYASANAKHLASLNVAERENFVNFIKDIERMGYAVIITSSARSTADQIKQKKANSKNATPGFSSHEYGIALDINVVKDGKWINKDSSLDAWRKTGIVDLAKNKYNLRWGGEFPGYKDPVHFDKENKYNANKLYAQAIKQFGTVEKIQGNKMKLTA